MELYRYNVSDGKHGAGAVVGLDPGSAETKRLLRTVRFTHAEDGKRIEAPILTPISTKDAEALERQKAEVVEKIKATREKRNLVIFLRPTGPYKSADGPIGITDYQLQQYSTKKQGQPYPIIRMATKDEIEAEATLPPEDEAEELEKKSGPAPRRGPRKKS